MNLHLNRKKSDLHKTQLQVVVWNSILRAIKNFVSVLLKLVLLLLKQVWKVRLLNLPRTIFQLNQSRTQTQFKTKTLNIEVRTNVKF